MLRWYQIKNIVIRTAVNSHGWAKERQPRTPMNPMRGIKPMENVLLYPLIFFRNVFSRVTVPVRRFRRKGGGGVGDGKQIVPREKTSKKD